jgi:glycosyltransferase involved in cell wall biosynthesis
MKTILFAGGLIPRKGYADLITAFHNLGDEATGWTLLLAGDGEMTKAANLARELGIADRVVLPGWVSGEDKEQLFASASVFCLPSYAEGFPMAILDAWSGSLPVIATPVGGIPDWIVDGENGLLFTPGDVFALTDCLRRLIREPELRNRLGDEGCRTAKTHFSLSSVTDSLAAIYNVL